MKTGWLSDLLKAASIDPEQLPDVTPITTDRTVPSDFWLRQELAAKTAVLARIAAGDLTLVEAIRLAQQALGR